MIQADNNNQVDISCPGIEPPPWLDVAEETAHKVLQVQDISGWELSICFCDDNEIRRLNRQYREKDTPTDILSFSQAGGDFPRERGYRGRIIAGDIVISVDSLKKNADSHKVPLQTELKRLIIHGILHLCGQDHNHTDNNMLILQEKILKYILEDDFEKDRFY